MDNTSGHLWILNICPGHLFVLTYNAPVILQSYQQYILNWQSWLCIANVAPFHLCLGWNSVAFSFRNRFIRLADSLQRQSFNAQQRQPPSSVLGSATAITRRDRARRIRWHWTSDLFPGAGPGADTRSTGLGTGQVRSALAAAEKILSQIRGRGCAAPLPDLR